MDRDCSDVDGGRLPSRPCHLNDLVRCGVGNDLGSVIGAVADLAGGYLKGKQEKAQAKQKLEVAKIEAQVQKVAQDGAWEETAIKASR